MNLAATYGWEVHNIDVKTPFFLGELKETVYVTQPEAFEKRGEEHKVYKLKKVFFGLKQAPRAWNNKLNHILCELQFSKCSKEPSIYRKYVSGDLLVVAVYVEDLFVTRTNARIIQEFKSNMGSKFDISDLEKLTYHLGIEVYQHDNGITLNQKRYATRILEENGMDKCNPWQPPMELGLKVSKAETEKEIDATIFRKNIGCLHYLIQTRLDLSFSVGVLSRYMQSSRESHEAAMKQMLQYLWNFTYRLSFERSSMKVPKLVGYS